MDSTDFYLIGKFINKLRQSVVWVGLFAVVGIWLIVFTLPDNKLYIWFLDVGQGDAIFIKTPQNHQILIDGGPDRTVLSHLSKAMPFWDKSIDAVFVTHPHADHITGVMEVLKNYRVEKVFVNPVVYDSPVYGELIHSVETSHATSLQFTQGDTINFDKVRLISFWPPWQPSVFEVLDVNKASMVFRLEYGEFSALFTGDAELSMQENPELALRNWEKVDVLKVPHQGSKGALSKRVLQEFSPSLAVISVGENNKFGHPAPEVVDLLQGYEVSFKQTHRDGSVVVKTTGVGDYTAIAKP